MTTIFTFIHIAHRSIMSIFGIALAVSALGIFMNFQTKEEVSSSSFLLNTESYTSDIKLMFWMSILGLISTIIYDYGLLFQKVLYLNIGRLIADAFAITYTFIITKWFVRLSKI